MNFEQVWEKFWEHLYSDIDELQEFPQVGPQLAHYTSLENLENILKSEQLWLSNPLEMNDLEEVRFGVSHGLRILNQNQRLQNALATDVRRSGFRMWLEKVTDEYSRDGVLDLYVTCFSLHEPADDEDGRLSMWRGYGNDGKGAAIVFDTSKIAEVIESPLVLSRVHYASNEKRLNWLEAKVESLAEFFEQNDVPNEYLKAAAEEIFRRLCLFAVFSKHRGFDEEREWRLVYFKDRDRQNSLSDYLGYFNGADGLSPKLKLPLKAIPGVMSDSFGMATVISSIIVGPSASSPLTELAVRRMLKSIGHEELIEKLSMSSIPYRG